MLEKEKNLFRLFILLLIAGLCLNIGNYVGMRRSEKWSTTYVHHEQQMKGYKYCPYCGKEFKEE